MKKIVTILIAIALIGMMGIAAANPEKVLWYVDGSTTIELETPITLPIDGSSYDFDLKFYDYPAASLAGQAHTLTLSITPISPGGNANDIKIYLTETDTPANTVNADGTVTLVWHQAVGGSTSEDFIDVSLVSSGPENAQYLIELNDDGYVYLPSLVIDNADESQEANNVPEFPTIALPVAAILGLAFIFQRRREEE